MLYDEAPCPHFKCWGENKVWSWPRKIGSKGSNVQRENRRRRLSVGRVMHTQKSDVEERSCLFWSEKQTSWRWHLLWILSDSVPKRDSKRRVLINEVLVMRPVRWARGSLKSRSALAEPGVDTSLRSLGSSFPAGLEFLILEYFRNVGSGV